MSRSWNFSLYLFVTVVKVSSLMYLHESNSMWKRKGLKLIWSVIDTIPHIVSICVIYHRLVVQHVAALMWSAIKRYTTFHVSRYISLQEILSFLAHTWMGLCFGCHLLYVCIIRVSMIFKASVLVSKSLSLRAKALIHSLVIQWLK